jgi:hypothetical protein
MVPEIVYVEAWTIVTVLPAAEVLALSPGALADPALLTWMAEEVLRVEGAIVRVTIAIIPFPIVEELIP